MTITAVMLKQVIIFAFFVGISVYLVSTSKIKCYNYNKYTPTIHHLDCLHYKGGNFTVPNEFTFCYRHMKSFIKASYWSSIFFGVKETGDGLERGGVQFDYWSYVPWIGLYLPGGKTSWVSTGDETDFNMLTWRHSCLTFNTVDGSSIMYENGRLVSENKFEEFVKFGESWPELIVKDITVGCINFTDWKGSHSGIVTDFQLFSRILSFQELEKWTGCQERMQGDLVSWDTAEWYFKMTVNGSEVEYREFEKDVCDMRNKSLHLFPSKTSFKKSLDLCAKVSGKLNE